VTIRSEDGSEAEPVYVVDGVVVDHVDGIDSENIESLEVFKGNSESPLIEKYDAKDGLIIITTKDGKLLHTPKEAKELGAETLGNESYEPVFYIVEDMPKFPGGKPALKSYIYSNLEYPDKAREEGIEGEVQVRFLVNEKGKVEKSEVLRSSYQGFDAPALKVINDMPDWTPGQQRGKAVKVWYVVSVKFNNQKK
jgi:TonB family protein